MGCAPHSSAIADTFPPKGKALYTENKLRPLAFRNSFRNIQKIKNGLRIKCYAPHHLASQGASPQGEAYKIG